MTQADWNKKTKNELIGILMALEIEDAKARAKRSSWRRAAWAGLIGAFLGAVNQASLHFTTLEMAFGFVIDFTFWFLVAAGLLWLWGAFTPVYNIGQLTGTTRQGK